MTMRQQIELYQDSLRKRRVPLNLEQMVLIIVLAIVLLAAIYAWGQYQVYQLRQQHEGLTQLIESQTETIRVLVDQQHSGPEATLEQQVRRLDAELRHLQGLQSVIMPVLENDPPDLFLRSIAYRKPAGLWLDSIFVSAGGKDIALRGKLYAPKSLPQFIEAMALDSAFIGSDFHTVWLGQGADHDEPAEPSDALGFYLVSGCRNNTCPGIESATAGDTP
jgi:type II secretory pathway pseudopilin PulG